MSNDPKTAEAEAASRAADIDQILKLYKANRNVELKYRDVQVRRTGEEIVLPANMSHDEALVWIQRQKDAEEKVVNIAASIPCFPLDGLIALRKAMEEMYGFTALCDNTSFFGEVTPPTIVQVALPDGYYEPAPIGKMAPPMYEGGFINGHAAEMCLVINGQIKKKFELQVQKLLKRTQEILTQYSIYKGTAFILDLSWKDKGIEFHPTAHAPVFMDVSEVNENGLILNTETLYALTANIFTLLERTDACRSNGIPLRHGCLLAGPYGTGKTLTARVTARKATRNNWTFVYLKTPTRIAEALKLAEMYAPAVLFTEDVDNVVGGTGRDAALNLILNTMDGVDTKDKPIVTVFTTNHVENIPPAVIRPGRIDTVIQFQHPDAEAALRFVDLYGRNDDNEYLLAPMSQEEKEQVGKALEGFPPAFISEAVQKAKRFTIAREGAVILGKITAADIMAAAVGLKTHRELMEPKEKITQEAKVANAFRGLVNDAINTKSKL